MLKTSARHKWYEKMTEIEIETNCLPERKVKISKKIKFNATGTLPRTNVEIPLRTTFLCRKLMLTQDKYFTGNKSLKKCRRFDLICDYS